MITNQHHLSADAFALRCTEDGEFNIAARFWTGGLRLLGDTYRRTLCVINGKPSAGDPGDGPGVVTLTAADSVWDALLSAVPPRFMNDIWPLIGRKKLHKSGDPLVFAQYFPAVMRAVELLRPASPVMGLHHERASCAGHLDSPIGRYIHLELGGQDYRIYFEEAGTGIPLILHHTAGSHASQWRHLFECKEITDRFRLIAFDLPFHGKSNAPVGPKWWANEYKLTASFLRSVPIALAHALKLDRPVFMGCSVGGMLALDLARYHANEFRAVISLEGALRVDLDKNSPGMLPLSHPQVSNDYKARLVNSMMSPTSPEAYRKETSLGYAAGWPPMFLGDLQYYMADYDLTEEASHIDTSTIAVHIMSGEYDTTGTWEKGKEAHDAIDGSTWTCMDQIGHFPMCENPEKFIGYLLPVLDKISDMEISVASPVTG